MELRYYINSTQISEPIGFDDFKTILKRTKQHGVSAETSIGELEFDGVAFGIIKTAYNTDIDTSLVFKAEIKCVNTDTWTTLYSGLIDLSTYMEQSGDYCSCKVSVGEIGVKTTFNNRVDTVVELRTIKSVDNLDLDVLNVATLAIPAKTLKYKSNLYLDADSTEFEKEISNEVALRVSLPFGSADMNEIKSSRPQIVCEEPNGSFSDSYFFINNTGGTRQVDVKVNAKFSIKPMFSGLFSTFKIFLLKTTSGVVEVLYEENITKPSVSGVWHDYSFNISVNTSIDNGKVISFVVIGETTQTSNKTVYVKGLKTSSASVVSDFNAYPNSVDAEMLFIDDSIQRVCDSISGLKHRSDWYKRDILTNTFGGGALKLLTTGAWIRNLKYVDGNKYDFSISFKKLIKNLSAIDNIGWGFSTEDSESEHYFLTTQSNPNNNEITFSENIIGIVNVGDQIINIDGEPFLGDIRVSEIIDAHTLRFDSNINDLYLDNVLAEFISSIIPKRVFVRVERWQWFYKNDVILEINSPANVSTVFNTDEYYTKLKCGYKKYAGSEDFNGVETYHTLSNYTTDVKAVDNEMLAECEFIADTLLIEYQRQLSFDKNSKDSKTDNDIYVLQAQYNDFNSAYSLDNIVYSNYNTLIDSSPLNTLISPAHNAIRQAERFYKDLKFTSADYNIKAKIAKYDIDDEGNPEIPYYNLEDSTGGFPLAENSNITPQGNILKPEIVSFEYPIKISDYKDILLNPYGTILVNSEPHFIKELIYKPLTGMCEFKLIPKI